MNLKELIASLSSIYEIYGDIPCVQLDGDGNIKPLAYVLDESRAIGVPSLKYLRVCLAGYRKFGFDKKNLFDAYYRSRREARL